MKTLSVSKRGSTNVEYVLLYLVIAVSVGIGVFFLATSINTKHTQVAAAFSDPAQKPIALGIQGNYMDVAIPGHPSDGTYYLAAYEDKLAMNGGSIVVASASDDLAGLLAAPAPTGNYELMASEDGESNWTVVASGSTNGIFADFTPAKSGLYYKIVDTGAGLATPETQVVGFWMSPVAQTYAGDKVAITIPHPPTTGVTGEIVDNYGTVVATATVTASNPTVEFTGTGNHTYTFRTSSGAATKPTAPLPTLVRAPITADQNGDGTWHVYSTGIGDPNYNLLAKTNLFENGSVTTELLPAGLRVFRSNGWVYGAPANLIDYGLTNDASAPDWDGLALPAGVWTFWAEDLHGARSQSLTVDAGAGLFVKAMDCNGYLLPNTPITVGGTPYLTDSAGRVFVPNVADGTYALSVSKLGYVTANDSVTVSQSVVYNKTLIVSPMTTGDATLTVKQGAAKLMSKTFTINNGVGNRVSNGAGVLSLTGLNAGTYTISYLGVPKTFTITAGNTTTTTLTW